VSDPVRKGKRDYMATSDTRGDGDDKTFTMTRETTAPSYSTYRLRGSWIRAAARHHSRSATGLPRRGEASNYEYSNHVVRLEPRASEADVRCCRPLRRPRRGRRNAGSGFGTAVSEWMQVGDR
jgi:hypothetical protein